MQKTPKVSVIIPVYNVEQYLKECLNSVIHQTLPDIEIICVNDGSTDGSLSILEEYRVSDARITVINQENRGLSAARNRGMKQACGEYIYFIDSDDYLNIEALEKAVQLADENDLDALRFACKAVPEAGEKPPQFFSSHEIKGPYKVLSGVDYLKEAKDNGFWGAEVWDVLWRHSFLRENGLQFKEGILYEDQLISFQAYMAAKRVLRIPVVYYFYRQRPGSITKSPKTYETVLSFFKSAEGILEYAFRETNTPEEEYEIWRAYTEMTRITSNLYNAISEDERSKVHFPRKIENELFQQSVARYQIEGLQNDLNSIQSSISFRVGRAITWLPRKIRGGIRCYREHGLKYTVRRTFEHLLGKN